MILKNLYKKLIFIIIAICSLNINLKTSLKNFNSEIIKFNNIKKLQDYLTNEFKNNYENIYKIDCNKNLINNKLKGKNDYSSKSYILKNINKEPLIHLIINIYLEKNHNFTQKIAYLKNKNLKKNIEKIFEDLNNTIKKILDKKFNQKENSFENITYENITNIIPSHKINLFNPVFNNEVNNYKKFLLKKSTHNKLNKNSKKIKKLNVYS